MESYSYDRECTMTWTPDNIEQDTVTLGQAFIKNYYTIFDFNGNNKKIGFYKLKWNYMDGIEYKYNGWLEVSGIFGYNKSRINLKNYWYYWIANSFLIWSCLGHCQYPAGCVWCPPSQGLFVSCLSGSLWSWFVPRITAVESNRYIKVVGREVDVHFGQVAASLRVEDDLLLHN